MWRRNHLPLTARIHHSYHELLQICIVEVKSLCEVWVKCLASHSIRNYRLNWNLHVGPGDNKELHKLLVEFLIYLSQPTSGAVVRSTPLFLQVLGSNSCHGKLFLQHFVTYTYTWAPGTIYDNLEHSIFKKNAYMWNPKEFYDDL
jgi:hypothetical protein